MQNYNYEKYKLLFGGKEIEGFADGEQITFNVKKSFKEIICNIFLHKFFLYYISGFVFGLYNECYFQEMWIYDQVLKPFLFKDVPLIAPFGWGLFTSIILIFSDFLQNKLPYKLFTNSLFLDIFLFTLFMAPIEYICSRMGLWTYVSFLHKWPPSMILGYTLAASFISSFARRIKDTVDMILCKKGVLHFTLKSLEKKKSFEGRMDELL